MFSQSIQEVRYAVNVFLGHAYTQYTPFRIWSWKWHRLFCNRCCCVMGDCGRPGSLFSHYTARQQEGWWLLRAPIKNGRERQKSKMRRTRFRHRPGSGQQVLTLYFEVKIICGTSRIRTYDQAIMSRLLYRWAMVPVLCFLWVCADSNCRPFPCQGNALTNWATDPE